MTLTTMHGTGVAIAAAILACDLSIDMVDQNDSHDGQDKIDDDFLHLINR